MVKNASQPGKYFDGNGLYLRVEPNGTKFWVQRIVIHGKRRELGLGSVSLVSLAQAREKALVNRKMAREGGDPLAARREQQAVMTFEQASRRVHELHSPTWRNAKYRLDFISSLERYAFPLIGKVPASKVTAADVLRVLTPIWTEKPETARRVRQRIGTVLKWAVAQGWRQDNPADSITQALPKVAKTQVHRKSLPYTDIADCLAAIRRSRAITSTKLALEFLVLTAARSGEVRDAVWDEIDLGQQALGHSGGAHEGQARPSRAAVGASPHHPERSPCVRRRLQSRLPRHPIRRAPVGHDTFEIGERAWLRR
ncbi:tyrosine-type recombinase/integrase [Paracoccus sphaerophysae]|uniref:tyrosine-type recombinase/integrase n=1 Tax=Paracoccus sphaerophysae TaxID=690417 RepID=UPI001E3327A1|nr:integrase arm-type DNA-binding domain-containing protein [Paracoccus sphaerophysae]